ncbi:MAG: hypothetical protein IJ038_07275 [Clostridia bacterium]|nr:hypothetical protein [Clostridia bacterium]
MKKFAKLSLVVVLVLATLLSTIIMAGAANYNEGDVIINETTIAQAAGQDGNTNAIFGDNTYMKWDGEKLVYLNADANANLALTSFPTATELASGYTVSVDVAMAEAPTSDSYKMINVGVGSESSWGKGAFIQWKVQGTTPTNAAGSGAVTYLQNVGSDNSKGTGNNVNVAYGDGSYTWGAYVNLKLKVGAEKTQFFVDNAMFKEINTSDLKNGTTGVFLGGRKGCTIHFDNFQVIAGTPADANESSATTTQRAVDDAVYYPGGTIILSEDMIKDKITDVVKATNSPDPTKYTYGYNTETGRISIAAAANNNLVSVITEYPKGLDNYTLTADVYLTVNDYGNNAIFGMGINASEKQMWAAGVYLENHIYTDGNKPKVYMQNKTTDGTTVTSSNLTLENDNLLGVTKTTFKIVVAPDVVTFYVDDMFVGLVVKSDLGEKSGLPFITLRGGCSIEIDNLLVYSGSEADRQPDFSKVIGEVNPIDAPDIATTAATTTEAPSTTTAATTTAATTAAVTTTAAETTAEEEKSGCGSSVGFGIVAMAGAVCAAAVSTRKRRRK